MKLILLFSFLALALVTFTTQVNGQTKSLEFLISTTDLPGNGVRYTGVDYKNAPSIVRSSSKLCSNGLWAMYTAINYGVANPSAVTVYPVKGSSRSDCTSSSAASILRTIYSFRQIAPLPAASDTEPHEGVEFCPTPYFIGTCVKIFQKIAGQESTIKSFGIQHPVNNYTVCDKPVGDSTRRCFCMAADNGPFIVPSLEIWPAGNPLKIIATFTPDCTGDEVIG